ncbi:predicted protein [Nematostella vectensis]|uniref:Uncharacterized protein n=3 Tax=Nematostella vectensis TaxID=45351 RepID=A7T8S5_NEMVE|nr:predicted protein [Nematostella vectensis]|eukprot:XP_001619710.1 hypothetical protein NEMVEDRAFT_v1g223908 [Nematostella vectensis]
MALTREVLEELLDKKLAPLQASLDFLNEKYDIILKKVSDQEVKVKELSKENSRLHSEVGLLRSTLSNQGKWLNDLEQYGRRECLEIRGIPEVKGEDTSQIACQVANLIGVKLSRQDISTSHRIKPKNSTAKFPPSIIVKFTSRDKRDETYKARGRLRELSTHNVPGLDRFKSNSIYLMLSYVSICSLFFVAMALTREVLEELLDKKLAPLQASLDFLNEKYDIILKKVSDQEVKVKELSKENSRLHSEVGLLRSTLSNQGKWLNDLEQYGRRECLEIRGIPEKTKYLEIS